jgi:hypothetical protein
MLTAGFLPNPPLELGLRKITSWFSITGEEKSMFPKRRVTDECAKEMDHGRGPKSDLSVSRRRTDTFDATVRPEHEFDYWPGPPNTNQIRLKMAKTGIQPSREQHDSEFTLLRPGFPRVGLRLWIRAWLRHSKDETPMRSQAES